MKVCCPKCHQAYELEESQENSIFSCLECGCDFTVKRNHTVLRQKVCKKKENMKVLTWVVAIIFAFALLLGGIMLVSSGNSEEDAAVTPIKDPWETALKAVENKDIVKFAAALASIDINARDEHGENLLFHTIRSGNKEMTQLLIQKKINLNQENKKGETPLYEAVREKNFNLFVLLLESGARMELPFVEDSLLGFAAENGCEEIVSFILNKRKNLPSEPINLDNPLFRAMKGGNLECMKSLVKHYNINDPAVNGDTFLGRAVSSGNIPLVEFALANHADVNAKNSMGESPFFLAIKTKNSAAIDLMIQAGQNIDWEQQNSEGVYLPMLCLKNGNIPLLKKCLNENNIHLRDKKDRGILYYACLSNNPEIFDFIYQRIPPQGTESFHASPLRAAIVAGNKYAFDRLKTLVPKSFFLERDEEGNNSLMLAARQGNSSIFDVLFSLNFDLQLKNKEGKTALDLARENKHTEIAQKISEKIESALLSNLRKKLDEIRSSSNVKGALEQLKQMASGFKNHSAAFSAISAVKAELEKKQQMQEAEQLEVAIQAAAKEKSNLRAIAILEAAIRENPNAQNLSQAKQRLESYQRKQRAWEAAEAEKKAKREKLRNMTQAEIKREVEALINKWLKAMQLSESTMQYWLSPLSTTTLFDLKSWEIVGAKGGWKPYSNEVRVLAESSTKGGFPIRRIWNVTLLRDDNLDWKILSMEE